MGECTVLRITAWSPVRDCRGARRLEPVLDLGRLAKPVSFLCDNTPRLAVACARHAKTPREVNHHLRKGTRWAGVRPDRDEERGATVIRLLKSNSRNLLP